MRPLLPPCLLLPVAVMVVMREVHALTTTSHTTTTTTTRTAAATTPTATPTAHATYHQPVSTITSSSSSSPSSSSSAASSSPATLSLSSTDTAGQTSLPDGATTTSPSLLQRVPSTPVLASSSFPSRRAATTQPPSSTFLPSLLSPTDPPLTTVSSPSSDPPHTTLLPPDPPFTPPVSLSADTSLSYSTPPSSIHPPPATVSPSFIHPPSTKALLPLSTDPPPATSTQPPPATHSTAFVTVQLLPSTTVPPPFSTASPPVTTTTTTVPPPYTTAASPNATTTVPPPHSTASPPTTTTAPRPSPVTDWPASTSELPPSVAAPRAPSTTPSQPPPLTTAPPPPTTSTTPGSAPLPLTKAPPLPSSLTTSPPPPPISTTVANLYSTITPPQAADYHTPHSLTTLTLPSTSTPRPFSSPPPPPPPPPPVAASTPSPPQEYPLSFAHASHLRQRPYFPAFRSTSSPTYSVAVPTLHPPASLPSSFLSFHISSSSSSSPSSSLSSRTPVRIERTIPSTAPPPPYFDPAAPTNISAQLGTHAYLPCRIRNLGNQSISWIRSRDSHILTVDHYTFISDQRFQAWHEPDSETWTLQVKYVQERDDGRYECQVSTEPKMSHFVRFHVVTPLIRIPGGPDMFVKSGSPVTIKCIITAALEQPDYIFWYQGQRRVVDGEGGGWRVELERVEGEETVGTLLIPTATSRDQGDYTCAPASLPNATVTLHVLNGEHPAAMHGGGPQSRPSPSPLFLCCLLTCWLLGRPLTPALCPR